MNRETERTVIVPMDHGVTMGPIKGSNNVLYLLIFISFTYWMSSSIFTPIFPLYVVDDLNASKLTLGLIMSISSVSSILLQVPLGIASNRIGKWLMISISLLIDVLVRLLYFFVPSYVWLYPIGILRAVAHAAFLPAANALASNFAKSSSERGKIMGKYMTSISGGLFLGPYLCSLLLGFLNYRQIFLLQTLVPFSGLVAAFIGVRRFNVKIVIGGEVKGKSLDVKDSLSRVFRSRNLIALQLAMSVYFFATGIFYTLFSIYGKEVLLLSASFIALLHALRALADTFTRIPSGYISDRIGRKRPLILGVSLLATAFICFSTLNLSFVIFGCIIFGISFGFRTVNMSALVGDSVSSEDVGLAMAVIFTTSNIGSTLGSIFAGAVYVFFPTSLIFQIAASTLLVVMPILFTIREGRSSSLEKSTIRS